MDVIELKQQQTLLAGSVEMYGKNAETDALAPEQDLFEW